MEAGLHTAYAMGEDVSPASPLPSGHATDTSIDQALELATTIVRREAQALHYLSDALERSPAAQAQFRQALRLALESSGAVPGYPGGKIIVVGVGKSGIIARKIASMLLSLGSQAVFLHPADCLHGDLGTVCPGRDVILALSYSGSTTETVAFLALDAVQQCRRIAMTGVGDSALARYADVWLNCRTQAQPPSCTIKQNGASISSMEDEAYPEIPAPTSSTTAMLALGDAFAIALTRAKGIERATFMRNHPGGSLGRTFAQSGFTWDAMDPGKGRRTG